eukprot:c18043_g4_i1 orf=188-361(+)
MALSIREFEMESACESPYHKSMKNNIFLMEGRTDLFHRSHYSNSCISCTMYIPWSIP